MTYAMQSFIGDVDFLTDEALNTVEICLWAHLEDDLDTAINEILGAHPTPEDINELLETQRDFIADYLGQPDWECLRKMALQNMVRKF